MVYQGNSGSPPIGLSLKLLICNNNNDIMSLAVPGSMMSHLATVLSSGLGAARGLRLPLPQRSRRVEGVRQAMLEALAASGAANAALRRRVLFATEAEQLWFLRTELMAAVSATQGESHAREVLHAVTLEFRELVPAALFASALHAPVRRG
jgi:hypothetical protein